MSVRVRSAYALALAETVRPVLAEASNTFDLAGDALQLCWRWADGVEVEANQIVKFVEGPDDVDLVVRQLDFPAGPARTALATISGAVDYVAHHAFEEQRINVRPSPIWEVRESLLEELTTLASETGQCHIEQLERLVAFLAKRDASRTDASTSRALSDDTLTFISGSVFRGTHD